MYIDSHAHFYLEEFDEERDAILDSCRAQGVDIICMPNIDSTTIARMREIAGAYESCLPMMGLHPCYVKDNYKDELKAVEKELASGVDYIAVGEIGIDLYWDKTTYEIQKEAFQYQLDLAKAMSLPVVIHSRDSLDVTIEMIKQNQDGNLKGIFHCFNGTVDQGKTISDLGFYMGIGGVVTFKNAGVDKVVSQLSINDIVLETDAPYLAPVPYRGKLNRPNYIPIIAEKISDLLEIETPEIAKATSDNCKKLFKI